MRINLGHNTRLAVQWAVLLCAAALTACNQAATPPAAPPDTRAADEAAILKMDEAWNQAAATGKVDGWMKFYTDDVVLHPPNEPRSIGSAAARKSIESLFALPEIKISWKAEKVIVARSGDIGYLYGDYELSFKDKGKTISEKGKMVEIMHKQPDGAWKCAVDMWSPSAPAK
ncbi:MAG: DUF4440 domain-containing protein [Acidobacteria bacterium]|nr:DUF4440 domain-containing protein [Acidobacteriota bacterium]